MSIITNQHKNEYYDYHSSSDSDEEKEGFDLDLLSLEDSQNTSTPAKLKKILKKIRKEMHYSPNFPDRDQKLNEHIQCRFQSHSEEEYIKAAEEKITWIKEVRGLKNAFVYQQPKASKNPFLAYTAYGSMLKNIHFGCCEEMALRGFMNLLEMPFDRLEVVNLVGEQADHVFIVINRDPASSIEDWKNWGKNCYILDIWAKDKNIFAAAFIADHLKNFLGIDAKKHALIEPFNPEKHTFKVLLAKVFFAKDLEDEYLVQNKTDQNNLLWLQRQLESFHQSKDPSIKKHVAEQIIQRKMATAHPSNRKLISILKSQMRYFLDPLSIKNLFIGPQIELDPFDSTFNAQELLKNVLLISTVDHLVKIAELFEAQEMTKASRKLKKIDQTLKKMLEDKICELNQVLPKEHNLGSILWSLAIYNWLFEKMIEAQSNGRHKEASAILQRLPLHAQQEFLNQFET